MSSVPTKRTTPSKRRRRALAATLAVASIVGVLACTYAVGGETPAIAAQTSNTTTYTGIIGTDTGSALSPNIGLTFVTPAGRVEAVVDYVNGTYSVNLPWNSTVYLTPGYYNGTFAGVYGLGLPTLQRSIVVGVDVAAVGPSAIFPTGHMVGTVTNSDGSNAVGVTVRLLTSLGAPANDRLGNPVADVTTDSAGQYAFGDLGLNTYKVVVDALGASELASISAAGVTTTLDLSGTATPPTTTTTTPGTTTTTPGTTTTTTTTTPSTTTTTPGTTTTTTPSSTTTPGTTTTPSTTTTTPSATPGEPTMAMDPSVPQARVADTRTGIKVSPATSPLRVRIADADAAVMQLTATDAEGAGYLTAYPCTTKVPVASNLNFVPGDPSSALTTVKLDAATGDVCIYASAPVNVIVDRMAVYGAKEASATGRFIPTDLARIVDTRTSISRFAAGETRAITVPGLPADAASVMINLTATNADGGYLAAFKGGIVNPGISNLNVSAGRDAANAVVVPVGPGGTIQVFSSAATDVLIDYSGYFTNGSAGVSATGLFVPLDPTRIFDTRAFGSGWKKDEVRFVTLKVPTTALRVVGTLTMISDTDGYATAWLKGIMPATSDVNFTAGTPAPNMVTVDLSRSQFKLYSSSAADAIFDIAGYFTS